MKFLCPSCKAKYQIADEKVAGRSVKMKCRKCGHLIHVSAVAGVGDALPGSLVPPGNTSAPPPPEVPAPAPVPAVLPKTITRATGPKLGAPGPAAKPTASKGALPAPTPPPRGVGPARLAPGLGSLGKSSALLAKAPGPAPKITSKPEAAKPQPSPMTAALNDAVEEEEATRIADTSALAGAFSLAVGAASQDQPAPDALAMPGEEWFVGINGVPVGPIKLSELRAKAGSGAVTRESLVWREGFEDWRPLKTFPELAAIVDESVSSVRASLTPFAPGTAIADPFAPSAASAVSPSTRPGVAMDDLEAAGIVPARRSSSAAWIAVVVALMFGLTIGFVVFSKQKSTETVIKYVEVPASAAANQGPSDDKGAANTVDESTVSGDAKSGPKKVGGPAAPKSSGDAQGLSGLKGLSGLNGLGPKAPDVGGPSGVAPNVGGQLDAGQIQSVVASHTGSVKRKCWQPALDARDKDAPTTARVNVSLTIAPNGSVSNATTGGDPRGYRGLASCISSSVHAWSFPPSGDSTTVNVPFVFAAQ